MKLKRKIEQIVNLSQAIREQEPQASTVHERQAAVAMAEVEKCINDLIMEKMPIRVISLSLFYFWLKLEAPLLNVSEKKANRSIPVNEAIERIIKVIRILVERLPSYDPGPEMQKLGEGINELKSHISDEILDHCNRLSNYSVDFCFRQFCEVVLVPHAFG